MLANADADLNTDSQLGLSSTKPHSASKSKQRMSMAKCLIAKGAALRQAASNTCQQTAVTVRNTRAESDACLSLSVSLLQEQQQKIMSWQQLVSVQKETVDKEVALLEVAIEVHSIPTVAVLECQQQLHRLPPDGPGSKTFVKSLTLYAAGVRQNEARLTRQLSICGNEQHRMDQLHEQLNDLLIQKKQAFDCNVNVHSITAPDAAATLPLPASRSKVSMEDWASAVGKLGKQLAEACSLAATLKDESEQTRIESWDQMCCWHDDSSQLLERHVADTKALAVDIELQSGEVLQEIDALERDRDQMAAVIKQQQSPVQLAKHRLATRALDRPVTERTKDDAE